MCKCRAQSASVGWDDVSFVLSLSHTHVLALLLSPTPSLSPFSFFFKQEQCVGYFGHFSAQQTVCNRCGTPRPVVWRQSGSLQNPAVTNLPAV